MTREKPRVLFVGRTRYELPLPPAHRRKWDALAGPLEIRVIAAAAGEGGGDARFRLVPRAPGQLDGAAFYARLPVCVARELRAWRPDVVVAESPYEAFAVELARAATRSRARVVVEVHGDWRTATRLYGSPLRRLVNPVADAVARVAVRRADGARAVSSATARLVREAGREPLAVFPAWIDLAAFAEPPRRPLPAQPAALFVGALEPTKGIDDLVAAWRTVAGAVPAASLHVVGDGSRRHAIETVADESPGRVRRSPRLAVERLVEAFDEASVLVMPSRSEGLGRVAIEALLRGRPIVATRVGGIPDVVEHGVSGLLVAPGDRAALAGALVRVLDDRRELERLAAGARAAAEPWTERAEAYAERFREVVESALRA